MATVRISNSDAQNTPDDVDWAKVRATTEADIQRQAEEDGSDTQTLGEPHYIRRAGIEVIPPTRIRRIREKLGPTQSAFAKRFGLSERTVAERELGRPFFSDEAYGTRKSPSLPDRENRPLRYDAVEKGAFRNSHA